MFSLVSMRLTAASFCLFAMSLVLLRVPAVDGS